jgi:hypothetical protein
MARDEKPRDPEMGNTCSYFLMAENREGGDGRSTTARAAAEALFDDAPIQEEESTPDWMKTDPPLKDDIESIFKPPDQ